MVLLLEKYVQYYTIINIIIIITFKSYQSCLLFLFPSAFHLQPDESDLQLSSSLPIHFPKTSHFSYTFSHTSLTLLSHFSHISLTILSHFSHTSLTFLLHFPHTSLTLLSNFPHISLTLPTHFSHTSLTLLSQFSHTSLTFLLHFSYTSLTLFSVCVLPTIWNLVLSERRIPPVRGQWTLYKPSSLQSEWTGSYCNTCLYIGKANLCWHFALLPPSIIVRYIRSMYEIPILHSSSNANCECLDAWNICRIVII